MGGWGLSKADYRSAAGKLSDHLLVLNIAGVFSGLLDTLEDSLLPGERLKC